MARVNRVDTEKQGGEDKHVHAYKIDGVDVVTSSAGGKNHTHTLKVGGRQLRTTAAEPKAGHTHDIAVEGEAFTSSKPRQPTRKQAPSEENTDEKNENLRRERSKKFGIEVIDGSALTYPKGFPTKLEQYADPVNLKFPIDTPKRTRNARVRFKQFANQTYDQTKSKRIVHTRIVERELALGIDPEIDTDDELDKLLPSKIRERASKAVTPHVLTWEAVRHEWIPDEGSGLPESLERDVPPRYRYWKCESQEDAIAVRNSLVEAGLFDGTVRFVDGEPRRVIIENMTKMYLPPAYDESETPVVPAPIRPVEKVATLLEDANDERDTALFDDKVTKVIGLDSIVERVSKFEGDWIVSAEDTPQAREVFKNLGGAFRLHSREDLIFATNASLYDPADAEWVSYSPASEMVSKALEPGRVIPILKDDVEERMVYGIVLEPDEVDAQNDTIRREVIRNACHKFMEDFGNLGLQHKEIINGQIRLLENFIAPCAFTKDGETIKEGSWIMAERIVDDELWTKVKKGEITGFSIGGSGVRRPVDD